MSIKTQYNQLKTVKTTNIPEIVEVLNYNFSVLLDNYIHKGIEGPKGDTGDLGSQGKRGASFMYLKDDMFIQKFEPALKPESITLDNINNAIAIDSTYLFGSCTNFDDIVHGDYMILPDYTVICYNSATGLFEPTTLKFHKSIQTLSKTEILKIIEDNAGAAGSGIFKFYQSNNKYLTDDNPTADDVKAKLTDNSVADIDIDDTAGYKSDELQFVTVDSALGVKTGSNEKSNLMHLSGHAIDYKNIVQNTIAQHSVNNIYAPKYNNAPIHTFIQNIQYGGLLLGNKNDVLKNFAHIRRTTDTLEILKNYSINESTNSTFERIALGNTIDLINGNYKLSLQKNAFSLFSASRKLAEIDDTNTKLDTALYLLKNTHRGQLHLLSIEENGKVVNTDIYSDENIYIPSQKMSIPTTQSTKAYIDRQIKDAKKHTDEEIKKLKKNITNIELQLPIVGEIKQGIFDINNLQPGWFVCDGKNGTPDLRGYFLRCKDDSRSVGSFQEDAQQRVTGNFATFNRDNRGGSSSGAFSFVNKWNTNVRHSNNGDDWGHRLKFDTAKVVRTADENRPKNYAVYFIIYLGV